MAAEGLVVMVLGRVRMIVLVRREASNGQLET